GCGWVVRVTCMCATWEAIGGIIFRAVDTHLHGLPWLGGVPPPLASWPVNGFPAAVLILLGNSSFLWLSFHTKETGISSGPWGGPPSTALTERASPPLEAHPWSADHGSHRAAHECCAGGGA